MKEISRSLLSAERDRQRKILEGFERTLKSAEERVNGIKAAIEGAKTAIGYLMEDLGEAIEKEA